MNEVKQAAQSYTRGALIGGVIFAVFALVTKRKLIMWTAIGAIGGGFVAYKVNDSKKEVVSTSKFQNYDI